MPLSGVPGGNSRLGYRRSHSCNTFQMITDFLTCKCRLCVTSHRVWYESNGTLSNRSRASGSGPGGNSGLFIFSWPALPCPSWADSPSQSQSSDAGFMIDDDFAELVSFHCIDG